jgi:hypothetical protein
MAIHPHSGVTMKRHNPMTRREFLRAVLLAGGSAALTACGVTTVRPGMIAAPQMTSPEANLAELRRRLMEIYDLDAAASLLGWDQMTYMPPAGAAARGRQLALLSTLRSQKLVDPQMGRLLDALQPYADSLPYDADDAGLIRVTRREYERMIKVPLQFVSDFEAHKAACYDAWTRARPANDFSIVQPYLEKTLDYSRQLANFFPGSQHIADPLIGFADPGMSASSLRAAFADLRRQLVPPRRCHHRAASRRRFLPEPALPSRPTVGLRARRDRAAWVRLPARAAGPLSPPLHDLVLGR